MNERSQPNSAQHASIPWRVFTNDDGTKLIGIGREDGEGILDAGFGVWAWNDPEGIANASFIVKAVNNHAEMVRILKAIDKSWLETFDRGPDGDYGGVALAEEHKTFWRDVRAVLSSMGEIEL